MISGLRAISPSTFVFRCRASAKTAAALASGTLMPITTAISAMPSLPPRRPASASAMYELKRNVHCTPDAKTCDAGLRTGRAR